MNKGTLISIFCKDSKNKTKKLQQTRKTCMLRLYLFAYARKCFFVLPYNTFCICSISVWFQALEWLFQSLEWPFHDLEWWFHALEWHFLWGNSGICLDKKKEMLIFARRRRGVVCKNELLPCFLASQVICDNTVQRYCFLLRKAIDLDWKCSCRKICCFL